jgi:hypothetical protein
MTWSKNQLQSVNLKKINLGNAVKIRNLGTGWTGSKNYATHNQLTLPRGRRQVGTQDLKQCGPWLI